ncbi:MAG: hypothetical protein [Caudoviricetes sp.]|nr:MAG: hypothetical protein [Caudoviricetes sp.]
MHKPYTYLIGWSKQNKYYYGVRFAQKCQPNELWVSYFTSSKHIIEFRKIYGEPDIIQIRKIFDDVNKARLWESKILKKLKVSTNENWINKTDNVSIDPIMALKGTMTHIGKKRSDESKKKMRGPKSESARVNMSLARKKLIAGGYIPQNPAFRKDVQDKMSKSAKLRKLKEYGLVVTPYGVFNTLKEAAKAENISYNKIRNKVLDSSFTEYRRVV